MQLFRSNTLPELSINSLTLVQPINNSTTFPAFISGHPTHIISLRLQSLCRCLQDNNISAQLTGTWKLNDAADNGRGKVSKLSTCIRSWSQDYNCDTHTHMQIRYDTRCHFNVRSKAETHTHTHTRLTVIFPGQPGWAGTRKVNQSGFYRSKRQWVAVASAGPYASLHLAPGR